MPPPVTSRILTHEQVWISPKKRIGYKHRKRSALERARNVKRFDLKKRSLKLNRQTLIKDEDDLEKKSFKRLEKRTLHENWATPLVGSPSHRSPSQEVVFMNVTSRTLTLLHMLLSLILCRPFALCISLSRWFMSPYSPKQDFSSNRCHKCSQFETQHDNNINKHAGQSSEMCVWTLKEDEWQLLVLSLRHMISQRICRSAGSAIQSHIKGRSSSVAGTRTARGERRNYTLLASGESDGGWLSWEGDETLGGGNSELMIPKNATGVGFSWAIPNVHCFF